MSDKLYRPLILTLSIVLAIVLGLFLGKNFYRSTQPQPGATAHKPLVLIPKARLAIEDARWSLAPDVPPAIGRREQRREVVHWTIREAQNEIAPGVIYDDAWGFEGRVPGPLLRVRVGDLVEVHLRNALNSLRTHNIDFHFVMGPGGGASALSVPPGAEAVLEARATAPGFYMFHCATPDIPMHIANGMYGFVLVEPEEGLPPEMSIAKATCSPLRRIVCRPRSSPPVVPPLSNSLRKSRARFSWWTTPSSASITAQPAASTCVVVKTLNSSNPKRSAT